MHNTIKNIILLIFCFHLANHLNGQISIERNFNLELAENDSIKSYKLESSLNTFLTQAQNNDYSNDYVDTIHLKKHEFFFTKLSGIGKDSKNFNQPLVLKSYPVESGNYRLTVSFTYNKGDTPFIYQVTELKAIPYKNHYRFYCPFEDNTKHFKSKTFDNVTYYYSNSINTLKAKKFVDFTQNIAQLTNGSTPKMDYYAFNNLDELLKSYGFLYSARQCNFLCYDLGFTDNQGKVYITGTGNENYVFGFIGDYLYYHLPNKSEIYWPFVQGLSTYYGGYGLSYDDIELLKKQFRNKLKDNPKIDFLEEFRKGRKSSINRHFSHYVMSSFLFEKALETKGFTEAFKLTYSGKNGERFFENLNEVLGVNESNFHKTIINLINEM